MVSDPADYSWSSYHAHAFGKKVALWKPHAEYLALGSTAKARTTAYRGFFAQQLSGNLVMDIRNALNSGLVLGDARFKKQIEKLTGIRQHHLKRGPRHLGSE